VRRAAGLGTFNVTTSRPPKLRSYHRSGRGSHFDRISGRLMPGYDCPPRTVIARFHVHPESRRGDMFKARSWRRRASTRMLQGLSRHAVARPLILSASLLGAMMLAPAIMESGALAQNGRIFQFTGAPCNAAACPGWQMLDNNPASVRIATAGNGGPSRRVYQLHNDGRIFRFNGPPCNGESCPGWEVLANMSGTLALAAGGGELYQLHNDGRIFQWTGIACGSASCPGWQMLDNNPATVRIAAGNAGLYQLHNDGRIF